MASSIQATRLRKGMPLDPTSNKNACFEIQDYLRKKGRYFASVTLEEGEKPSDNRVVFNVSEGPIVRRQRTSPEPAQRATSWPCR